MPKFIGLILALSVLLGLSSGANAHDQWNGNVYYGPPSHIVAAQPCCFYPAYYGYAGYYPAYYYQAVTPMAFAPSGSIVVYTERPQTVVFSNESAIPTNQPSPIYTDNAGHTCREYQAVTQISGNSRSVYGTACLQSDGSWHVVN
jgi:hypothetical protein